MPPADEPSKASLRDRVRSLGRRVRGVDPGAAREAGGRGIADVRAVARLTVDYVKQETKAPLLGLGRYVAFGAAAATMVGTGAVLLCLALLRGIQSGLAYDRVHHGVAERGPLSGSLSWVPYLLTVVGCVGMLGLIRLLWRREERAATARGAR